MSCSPATSTNSNTNNNVVTSSDNRIERAQKRLSNLRKHHANSAALYDNAQPARDASIKEETQILLKSTQANGTKANKSQKVRAPKQSRTAGAATGTAAVPSPGNVSIAATPPLNAAPSPQQIQMNHARHASITSPYHQNSTPPLQSMQPNQQQQSMQLQQHSNGRQMSNQNVNGSPSTRPPNSNGPNVSQPAQIQRGPRGPQIIGHMSQHAPQPQQHFYANNQQSALLTTTMNQQRQTMTMNHLAPILPNDLDLNMLHGGLDCDVDSIIKHEISVEGQLDFDFDLLHQLDHSNFPQMNSHHSSIQNYHSIQSHSSNNLLNSNSNANPNSTPNPNTNNFVANSNYVNNHHPQMHTQMHSIHPNHQQQQTYGLSHVPQGQIQNHHQQTMHQPNHHLNHSNHHHHQISSSMPQSTSLSNNHVTATAAQQQTTQPTNTPPSTSSIVSQQQHSAYSNGVGIPVQTTPNHNHYRL